MIEMAKNRMKKGGKVVTGLFNAPMALIYKTGSGFTKTTRTLLKK